MTPLYKNDEEGLRINSGNVEPDSYVLGYAIVSECGKYVWSRNRWSVDTAVVPDLYTSIHRATYQLREGKVKKLALQAIRDGKEPVLCKIVQVKVQYGQPVAALEQK